MREGGRCCSRPAAGSNSCQRGARVLQWACGLKRLRQFVWRLVLLTAVLLGAPMRLCAQEALPERSVSRDYLVENWQAKEGLPRNTITSITQDQTGYLWLGTPYGLIRFDGMRFEALEQEVSPALARGEVWQVVSGPEDALWVATRRSGLVHMKNGKLQQRYGWASSTGHTAVDSIALDKNGTPWVTMGNGKLRKFVDGQFVTVADLSVLASGPMWVHLKTDARGALWFYKRDTYGQIEAAAVTNVTTIPRSVITLAPSHDGGMWLSTGNDLRHLLPGQTRTEAIVMPLTFGPNDVRALYEDRAGTLWVSTLRQGLLRLVDGRLQRIEGVHHVVLAFAEDREGNLWMGTEGGGLFKLCPRVFKLIDVSDGLPEGNVLSVCENWIVPQGGRPLKVGADGTLESSPELTTRGVTSVLQDAVGGVWFATGDGVVRVTKEGRRESVSSLNRQWRVLHFDQQANLWAGNFRFGLFRLPAGQRQDFQSLAPRKFGSVTVTAIAENKAGQVWVGTSLGEIHRYDGSNFVTYRAKNGLGGSPIGALMFSSDGTLWAGTLGGGLGALRAGQFKFATIAAGLPDNVISQLIEDDAGWLWVGSSRGIFRVRMSELVEFMAGRRKEVAAVHFGRSDGLENIQCSVGYQPSVWKTAAGELRFATTKGVVTVNPEKLPVKPPAPQLVLERVLLDGVEVTNRTRLQLPHDYKRIQFCYAALCFTSPDKVRYRRQLSGFDEGWVEDGPERTATYLRLPPGRYQFQLTACNNSGFWNETPVALSFEVIPAVWQTNWFRLGALLLFAGAVAAVARSVSTLRMRRQLKRLEQEHALDRERARIARDLHDDLGARLTQMAFLTDLAATEPTASGEMKTQLGEVSAQARHATRSLDETVWMLNPQKDSLPHLIEYIGHYANEFFRRTPIRCRQHICVNPSACSLSSELRHHIFFAVKEALNNVLKHSGATEVRVRIGVRRPLLRIVIADNGKGFSPARLNDSRHGLANLHRRLEEAGGRCVLRSAPGRGTRLILRIKLPDESPRRESGPPATFLATRRRTHNSTSKPNVHSRCYRGRRPRRAAGTQGHRHAQPHSGVRRGLQQRRGGV